MQCSFVSIKKCQISPFNDDEKLILSPRRCDHVWLPKFPNNVKVKMWRNITSVEETSPELLIGGTEQNPLVIALAFSGCKIYLEIIIFFPDYVHQTKTNETKHERQKCHLCTFTSECFSWVKKICMRLYG